MMPGHGPSDYQCGELRVAPALGLVSNGRGESIRLGPVNMKVLAALLAQPGRMISRAELFEEVWPSQVVSDDALTRCVSDIRGQLRKLSGRDDWIETLPKRGYRWVGPVGEAAVGEDVAAPAAAAPVVTPVVTAPPAVIPDANTATPGRGRHPLLWFVWRGVAYLVTLVIMASIVVWAIDRLSGRRDSIVAVLPVTTDAVLASTAAELDQDLRSWLAAQHPIRVLARSAIDARPANPFPYFHYEFGARWVVEASLQKASGHTIVSIAVADARTGLVDMQHSERTAGDVPEGPWLSDAARKAMGEFFDAQLRH